MNCRRCFSETFRECCTNLACAPFFLLALAFYAFYYCWPYTTQLPYHMSVAVVDADHSPLSRRMILSMQSSPNLDVKFVTRNREEAIGAMKSEQIVSIIGIPPNFERDILAGIPSAMTLVSNGAFIVKSRSSIAGAGGILSELATEAIAEELMRYGAKPSSIIRAAMRAPALIVQPMYNTIGGYLNFVVPIVFMIIFQTLMLCGSGMLFFTLFSATPMPKFLTLAIKYPVNLLSMQAAIFCICFFWTLLIEGLIFYLHGINSFQNVFSTILMGLTFSITISSLGILLGLLFRSAPYIIPAVVMSSIPSVFISGNLFPGENIPLLMRIFAWFIPSTPGSTGMVRASQAGATVFEIFPYIFHLLMLAVLYLGAAFFMCYFLKHKYSYTIKNI